MATEVNIQESACLKKGEREENALASEIFEEKVTELPGNQVKQLETSSYVAEIVNTPLVTGKPTDESGIFFQALSVTMVIADEHSNAPESCNAAKQTEPEDKETIKTEEKAIESVTDSQDAAVEDIKETTTEYATDVKEQDLNATTREFVKEETEGKSVDAQEVTEQCETGSKNIEEQKSDESVEKIEKDEETKEIKADVETETGEQNGLLQAVTTDAAISTQTRSQVETTEHKDNEYEVVKSKESIEEEADTLVKESIKTEEPDDEKATEKEVREENSPEKAELEISDSTIAKEQGDIDGVTSSLESLCVDAEETTTVQHVTTTTVDLKEHDLDKNPKEFIKEETEDRSLDATEASEECVKEETEQNPEESVEKNEKETTEHGEKEQDINVLEKDQDEDDITHAKEVTFEKSLQEASHHKEDNEPEVVQVEGSIEEEADEGASTQTTLVKESFKSVEPDDEKAIVKESCEISDSMTPSQKDQGVSGGVTSLQESPSVDVEETATVQHVTTAVDFKEQDLNEKPTEFIKEETEDKSLDAPEEKEEQDELLPAITKDENEGGEKEQEVNVVEKDEGEDDVTSVRDVTCEKVLQEENHHNEDDVTEVVTAEESTEKDVEVIKSSQETEKETLINEIPSDVCISTQTEPVEGTTETGQGLSATQRETVIEEAKDKSVDVREEIEQYGDRTNDEKEQKVEECVNETAHSTKEQEEHTEEIKPKAEATEEKDVDISTQTESQQEPTKNEENATESDDVQKQKSDNTIVNEACEQIDVKQTESKEELELSDSSDVKSREIADEDIEETKSGDVIITDVSSSTQTEYNDETEEGVKHSERSNTKLNVDETLSKEEELEKEEDIKTSEDQGGEEDVTSSQHASNEDIQEATIGQHDTTVAYVEEGQGENATPKEILTQEAEDKSVDAKELGQVNEQKVEEIHSSLSETTSQNPEDGIKKEDEDLSHVNVGGTNDFTTKEEKCTLEQETVEEHSVQDEVSKENVTELNKTTEVEAQEDITPSSFETSTKDASNSEKEKAEIESLPVKDLETVSEVQIPEVVPKSEDLALKEECFIPETETHLDEEKETVAKETSSDEKTEVQGGSDDVTSSQNAPNENIQETTGQHDTTVTYVVEGQGVSATAKEILKEEPGDKSIDVEESLELGEPNEQNVEESKTTTEIPEDEVKKEEKDLSHESVENTNDNTTKEEKGVLEHEPVEEQNDQDEVSKENVTDSNETTEVEHQEDITPTASFEASTADASNAEKERAESENFPIDEPETVSEVQVPELVPRSEDSVLKEKCVISETKTHLDEEKGAITKEISRDEKTEVQGGGDDVTSSQNASNEDMQEKTIGQDDTPVAYVEEEQCVSATPNEILKEETDDKPVDVEETSLKVEQPNEQNDEKTIIQDPQDEIKKVDRDLSHESVEDTNDDAAKEEKSAIEHERVEEHSGLDEVSKEKVNKLNKTMEVEPQDITPSGSLETSIDDTSNSEKEKTETEILPLEDLETVSEVQIPESVPKSEESVLKEEHCVSETETHLDEEKEIVTKEILSDVTSEQATEIKQETVKEVCEETSSEKVEFEEGLKLSDSSNIKINEKEITFKNDEEKDQEVNMSTESQGEDNITSSQTEVSEEREDLQEKYSHNEGNEGDFIKSGEGDYEEIKRSVETEENTEPAITTNISTQMEPNADCVENEENDEKAKEDDENETVSRDANLEKKQEDIKETNIGEHATSTTVASFEEGQSLGTVTKEVLGEAEEGDKSAIAQKETEQHEDGETGEGEHKPEEYTEEIKPSVETNEEKDVCISTHNESQEEPTKNEENVIERDDQKKKLDNLFVKEVCEESDITKTESEERQVSDSSDVKTREIVDEDTEETKLTDVSSSTETENKEKSAASDGNNDEETLVHDEVQTEKPQSPLVEVAREATRSKIVESEEEVKHSESSSTTLSESETLRKEEILEKEDDIKTSEVKVDGVEVTNSQDTSNEDIKETTIGQHDTTAAHAEEQYVSETPEEIAIEEAEDKLIEAKEIPLELGQPDEQTVEAHPYLSETISENPEDEIKKDLSHESLEDTNDSTTIEEKGALEHELVEEHSGLDEVPKENVADSHERTEVKSQEDITPSISLEASTEDTSNSEKEKTEIESLPVKDLETVSEPNTEESVLKAAISETETHVDEVKETVTEEISSDEKTKQASEIKQETVREVCEETSLEKAEFEGVKLSDTSIVEINEKEITTFKDDDQEAKMSAKSEGEDNITSSQNEESEEKEGLQEKIDHNEGNEDNAIESGEVIHEDIEEIKSSADTKDDTENVIATTSSTQIEPTEETTEKNGEKAIESDKNEITSREIDLEEKLEDVCSLAQTEPKEETIENKETNEEAISNEKEQESAVAELQGGGNDVLSSRDAYNDGTEETAIGQDATTPVHAEEASEQSENETKDKIEQHEESVNKHVYSSTETVEESIKEEEADAGNTEIESKLEAENQADSIEDKTEIKDEVVLTEKVSKELEQSKEQNVDEIETCLTETISDLNDSQDEVSKEKISDLNETTAVEPREDVTPSGSLETSTESTKFSDKAEAVNENLPIDDLESVTEEHIPEVMPKSEDSKTKEECPVSATDIGTVTKEISSYETLETHGSTPQPENSYSTPEENVTQSEIEDCSETVKDVILTEEIEQVPLEIEKEKEINDFKEKIVEEDNYSSELEKKSAEHQKELLHEISNSDSIPAENPEVTEVSVDSHIGQEDLQGKEDISCVSKVTTDVDQEPKEEGISSLEDDATVESDVDLSNRESTAYPLEDKKLATRALESDCDVQIPQVVADLEGSKLKEECVVLATAEHADKNNVVEQDTKTDEISSAPDNEQETVTEAPTKSDEAKSSDIIIEEKALTKENLEIHGELKPSSEPVIEEQVIIETKPQPEQSEITCENITNDENSESKLEEEVTLAPENAIKSIESQNEIMKNIVFADEVVVETGKEKEVNEIERQVSEKDNCPTELDNTSTPDQKELANEIEYSKPIADANTEVAEVKAEIQTEVEDIKAAEDLSCLSKASSVIETSEVEMHEDTEQTTTIKEEVKADSINEASKDTIVTVLEDSKSSELQSTDRELVSELQIFAEDQTKINERCIENEDQGNLGVEVKDVKSEKESVEDAIINEVIVEDEKAKESKSIEDTINEEAKLNQLTTETDEVCQIEKSSSRPDELLETKKSLKDTEEPEDETLTVIKGPYEESETVASELKLEDTVTDKEKETLNEPQADDSAKITYDSTLSSTKPIEDSETVPECREVSAILTDNLPEASPEILLAKHEDKITEDPKVLVPSLEKDEIDLQKHEKDLDYETEVRIADVVSNVENHKEQKKETDESMEVVIPVEDVKTSTRELEFGSVDLEAPSVIDATADKANIKTAGVPLESTCGQSKPIEESSGVKQEPLELDASKALGTEVAEDLKISPKYVPDDLIKVSQTHPEIQKYEVPKESHESKILTEKTDSSNKQEEPVAKSLIPEAANLKPDTAPVSIDRKEKSESAEPAKIILQEPAKEKSEVAKDQQVEREETGFKTDEEYEEAEDNEDDEKTGSCSDAPVMVEASKDIEVKAHKKSHNILSGVGSKVKHSIAKVKKAITGKSSPTKSPSPKAKDHVIG